MRRRSHHEENRVVNNVAADPRYLPGSELVKSEMVVPILTRGALFGEIDINSYFADTFNFDEQKFVEACAALVSELSGKAALSFFNRQNCLNGLL